MANETVFEGSIQNARETVLEDSDLGNHQPRVSRITLPESISEQYEYVRDLPSGAESDAILLRDKQSGEEVFFKFYRPGLSPDPMAMLLLKNADPRYVARLIDYQDSDEGCWEIQEYYQYGSLETWGDSLGGVLSDNQIEAFAKELADDLKYLHGLGSGIAHRDLKPSNILVKSADPITLVLADFGLAKAHQNITHLTTTVKGTWHYAAPEVQSKQSSSKSDWFSMGAILYEYSTGRCLFSDADGNPVSDDEARARCMSGYYSADLVKNARIRLLISGLLCWDKNERWGAKEVERWLAGESPTVSYAKPGTQRSSSTTSKSRISYRTTFSPELASNYSDLARIIRDNWTSFADMLAGRPDEKLMRFIEAVGQSVEYAAAAQDILRIIPGSDAPEYKLVQLQVLLDPSTTPVFRGVNLDGESIATAINKAKEGDTASAEWLDAAVEARVFASLSEITGSNELSKADYNLTRWRRQLDEALSLLPDDRKEIGKAAKATANPILVESALSLGATGESETIDSINRLSDDLCSSNYVRETEAVAPIIGLLKETKKNDIGSAIVFNAYLMQVREAETGRSSEVYEQAKEDIAARRYGAAIEKLETIPSFMDADDMRQNAQESLTEAAETYEAAMQEANSSHFERAYELFSSLEGYENASDMAAAAKKAAAFMDGLAGPEKRIEADIEKVKRKIEQSALEESELGTAISETQEEFNKADEHVRDAEYALDVLCMNASAELSKQIRACESRRSEAAELVRSKTSKDQSARSKRTRSEGQLKEIEYSLESARKTLQSLKNQLAKTEKTVRSNLDSASNAEAKQSEKQRILQEKTAALAAANEALAPLTLMESKLFKPFGFKNDLQAAREAVTNASLEYETADAEYRNACAALESFRSQAARLQAECNRLAGQIESTGKEIERLEAEVRTARALLEDKKSECEAAAKDLRDAEAAVRKLDEEIAKLHSEVEQVRTQTRKDNSGELDGLVEARKPLKARLDELHKRKQAAASAASKLQEERATLQDQFEKASKKRGKKKIDPKVLFSYCTIFSDITEGGYRRYLGISKAIQKREKIRFGEYSSKQLEWDVLRASHGRALLLGPVVAKKALDESGIAKTWDECSLFSWLNEEFFKGAFDKFEQEASDFAGGDYGFKVSVPDRDVVSEISFYISSYETWWSAELVRGAETREYRQFEKQYIKDHVKKDDCKEIISKIKSEVENDYRMEMYLRLHPGSVEGLIFENIIERNSSFLQLLELKQMQNALGGGLFDMLYRMNNRDEDLSKFKRTLAKLRQEALESYGEDPFVEERLALKIEGAKLESDGKPLTEEADVRPIVWIPYYFEMSDDDDSAGDDDDYDDSSFAVGDCVEHKSFGRGRVTKLDGDVIHVRFDKTGQTKRLLWAYAPLKKARNQ